MIFALLRRQGLAKAPGATGARAHVDGDRLRREYANDAPKKMLRPASEHDAVSSACAAARKVHTGYKRDTCTHVRNQDEAHRGILLSAGSTPHA